MFHSFTSKKSFQNIKYIQRFFSKQFQLNSLFLLEYKNKIPPFGFNGLGELVYMRTYSRINNFNEKESWYQTVERVI